MWKCIGFLFCLFLVCLSSYGQEDTLFPHQKLHFDQQQVQPIAFDGKEISRYQKDPEFQYIPPEENLWTTFKSWLAGVMRDFREWLLEDVELTGFWLIFFRLLPYLVIFAILGFGIWLFIKLNVGAKLLSSKPKPGVFLSDEEQIIAEEDITQLIETARNNEHYRLAVRYSFLFILKLLKEASLVDYQPEKTNREYAKELENMEIKNHFQYLAHIYDYTWYGNFPVDISAFQKVETEFKAMQTLLKATPHGT